MLIRMTLRGTIAVHVVPKVHKVYRVEEVEEEKEKENLKPSQDLNWKNI